MSKKWKYLFYGFQFVWCIWLVATTWSLVEAHPAWYNISALTLAVLLLIYWLWMVYRVAKPKVRKLDITLEGQSGDGFWVTVNDNPKAGPFTHRHEAFDYIIDTIKETK